MRRRVVAALMALVFAMWSAPLGAQEEAAPPDENFTSLPMLCQAVFLGILVQGTVTNDIVILTNPSAVAVNVTAQWARQDGTTNTTNFVIPARTSTFTVPGDVGFTTTGVYWVRVSGAGNLAILAQVQRLQDGKISGVGSCFFVG
jgi:hypothetical protein